MVPPPDVGELGVGATVAVGLLYEGLVGDAVEVFVQAIQQKRQQFLFCFDLFCFVVMYGRGKQNRE